jgi:alanyl-tRNA synthetase
MTDRLYYQDSFLYDFQAEVRDMLHTPRPALILNRTAFYPTSGGQIFDTGWITSDENTKLRVTEVADAEDGKVVHYLEAPVKDLQPGTPVRGLIDPTRRRDHMQQHSGQHVLSAAFIRLFNMPTVSFHMADDYCSIDLDTPTLTKEQIESAERLANEIILENRPVEVRNVTRDEATKLGLRKLPPAEHLGAPEPALSLSKGLAGVARPGRGDDLRLIDIRDFDLTACGGTHVNHTGQIASVLLRKTEKVRQGWRVEFVAGQRAVATARRDFTTLTETAALFSAHIYDVPAQARKSLDEIRSLRKQREHSQEELAAANAATLLAEIPEAGGRKLIVRTFADRDLTFVKLLAQKLTHQSFPVVALLATKSPQPSLIFAQSAGQPHDMGALMKQTMLRLNGRGGGSKDLAQGGASSPDALDSAISEVASKISST